MHEGLVPLSKLAADGNDVSKGNVWSSSYGCSVDSISVEIKIALTI